MQRDIPSHTFIDESAYSRIVIVGDIHGYNEPVEEMINKIDVSENDLLIFIGDYIDRGPASKQVVDYLITFKQMNKNTLFLKGNHEDMMLGSMGTPAVVMDVNTWLYNGGSTTLASYGMNRKEIYRLTSVWDDSERFQMMKDFIPESHIDFFLDLQMFIESEHYFFCHAGINPYNTIYEGKMNTYDLLWMRDHIYSDVTRWEKIVVCGHTPLRDVLLTDKLICIDTGLYYYGKLSAIDVLSREIYQVHFS